MVIYLFIVLPYRNFKIFLKKKRVQKYSFLTFVYAIEILNIFPLLYKRVIQEDYFYQVLIKCFLFLSVLCEK